MKSKLILLLLICCTALTACADPTPPENSVSTGSGAETKQQTQISETTETAPAAETEAGSESPYPEFTGIAISEEGLTYSDLNKTDMYQPFCFGGGMVYFSNPDDGWRLYSYDGETAECLTDVNAYGLNYYDGGVYFLSSSKEIGLYTVYPGSIYRYDIQSGKIEQIGNDAVSDLRVNGSGLFYSKEAEDKKTYVYKAYPQTGEEERICEGRRIGFIDDYIITCEPGFDGKNRNCFLQKDNEKICLVSEEKVFSFFVHNGVFYYANEDYSTRSIDLRTGEKADLPMGISHTFCGGALYFSTQGLNYGLYKTVNGKSERIEVSYETWNDNGILLPPEERYLAGYTLRYLYSDNDSLYALAEPNNGSHTYYMAKLETQNIENGGETSELTFVKLLGNKTNPKPAF